MKESGIVIVIAAVLICIIAVVLNKLGKYKNTSPETKEENTMETETLTEEAPATVSLDSARENFTKTETTATILLKIAIFLVLIISLIGGIMVGNAMQTPIYSSLYDISDASGISYEWGTASIFSMFGVWISGGIASILMYSRIEMIRLLCGLQDKSKDSD